MTPRKNNRNQPVGQGQTTSQVSTPDKLNINEMLAKLDLITHTIMETNDKVKKIEEDLSGIKVEVKKIGTLEHGINQLMDNVKHMADKLEELDGRVERLETEKESYVLDNLWLEMKYKERFLRFRKIPEQDKEDLTARMVEILAEFTGRMAKDVELEIDETCRVNSKIVKEKNLPRDVIVTLMRKAFRNEILHRHYDGRLKVDDIKE
uniref:Uncharacterized protein n=1 Tax=Sphaerodactylus townsendi TaxID=933632 RepID=A0ACB8FIK2_9SAUR